MTTAARPADIASAALHGITPLFIDESPFDIERLLGRARFLNGFSHNPRFANLTLAGVEMGLTLAKVLGEEKAAALGAARKAVLEHPLVQEAIALFSAEVRTVKLPNETS